MKCLGNKESSYGGFSSCHHVDIRLFTVFNYVRRSGNSVSVRTEPGKGTTAGWIFSSFDHSSNNLVSLNSSSFVWFLNLSVLSLYHFFLNFAHSFACVCSAAKNLTTSVAKVFTKNAKKKSLLNYSTIVEFY